MTRKTDFDKFVERIGDLAAMLQAPGVVDRAHVVKQIALGKLSPAGMQIVVRELGQVLREAGKT